MNQLFAECTNCSFTHEYISLLRDGPHWAFEYTLEAISFVLGFVGGKKWLRRHDKKHVLNKAEVQQIVEEYLNAQSESTS